MSKEDIEKELVNIKILNALLEIYEKLERIEKRLAAIENKHCNSSKWGCVTSTSSYPKNDYPTITYSSIISGIENQNSTSNGGNIF
jgi:hypothetical protein